MTGIFHIVLARKPIEGTIAENCLQWGCGALWIDGCRVGIDDGSRTRPPSKPTMTTFAQDKWTQNPSNRKPFDPLGQGRFPANLILDSSASTQMGEQSGTSKSNGGVNGGALGKKIYGHFKFLPIRAHAGGLGDSGSASRFFFNFSEQEADE